MTFLLVHGAWHGGWCWRQVASLLRKAGHEVHAPSLTGLGERRHLVSGKLNLDTHIEDVSQLIEMEDLHKVVLVGHSYGGMVVTGVADRAAGAHRAAGLPRRLRARERQVRARLRGARARRAHAPRRRAHRLRHAAADVALGPDPARRTSTSSGRARCAHPYATMAQPISLTNIAEAAMIPKTFVYCSSPATGSFDQFAAKYRNDPAWRFHELQTGHDAMILMPEEVAEAPSGSDS